MDEILEKAYRTPDLGNKVDPLEELLYLLITQRTRIDLARKVFDEFTRQFYPWHKALSPRNQAKLKQILEKGGRGNLRYRAVTEVLGDISERFGEISLEFLRSYPLEKARDCLLSLPWVGEKTAYCILMYSLRQPVFPADSNVIRVFKRTGIFDQINIKLDRIDHRTAQRRIAPTIPGDIAYTLHVNMVMHGRLICTKVKPKCSECAIRQHCRFYLTARRRESQNSKFTMIDLFCGSGGISYGFACAGIRPVLAIDNHQPSCETYKLNVPWVEPGKVLKKNITDMSNKEIRELTGRESIDILVAGVPCQGFSKVGLRSKPLLRKKRPPEKESVNRLFMQVIQWTRVLKPRVVLLENVPAMGSSEIFYEDMNVGVRQLLEKSFRKLKYATTTVYLNSADFGVPQVRKRLFFIASRNGSFVEEFDKKLSDFWSSANRLQGAEDGQPLEMALRGLPKLRPREGTSVTSVAEDYPTKTEIRTSYEEFVYDSPQVVFNHIARYHNNDDMLIISSLLEGETYKKIVSRKPDVIKKRKKKIYSLENFHDKFYRLNSQRPCRTIVSHLAKDGNSFIHPRENRSITVREAARVQGFPDSFVFCGSRTAQFIQVGNAVPPPLAMIIGLFLKSQLEGK